MPNSSTNSIGISIPFIVDGKGTAKEALDGVDADWTATFKKYKRYTQR